MEENKQKLVLKKDAFKSFKEDILQSIKATLLKLKKKEKEIDPNLYPIFKIKDDLKVVISSLVKKYKLEQDLADYLAESLHLSISPSHIDSDITINAFNLAKILKKSPIDLSKDIIDSINKSNFRRLGNITAAGAFINIKLNKGKVYQDFLKSVYDLKDNYGKTTLNSGKTALIEYSSPNIAKPIGIGHLRSTIIGQTLSNIYLSTGFKVIQDNYLGDWGTQFGKLIYAYKRWLDEAAFKLNPIETLKNLYIKFHEEANISPELNDEARKIFKNLENKNPELIVLWKKFRDLSIKEFKNIYEKLGVNFDYYIGESFVVDDMAQVIKDCLRKHLARKLEDGNTIVVDTIKNLPAFLLQKKDGSSLYITRDLAMIKFRVKTFKPNMMLYVVGKDQELYFKQLFSLASKLSYLGKSVARHIDFGLVLKEGKKMATRSGSLIELKDLIAQSILRSKEIIKAKNPNLSEKDLKDISQKIGIGAIIYNDLRQSRTKDIAFDWNKMLDFESGSAVYLQYSYVRISSIIKKINESGGLNLIKNYKDFKPSFEKNTEFYLVRKLMFWPLIILEAQKTNSPHILCTYLEELAKLFNNFYSEISIIKTTDKNLKVSRIELIKAIALVLKNGLGILNIQVPDKM